MKEILERLRWWLTPGKDCRGCCLGCRYFHICKQDKPSGGVPVMVRGCMVNG